MCLAALAYEHLGGMVRDALASRPVRTEPCASPTLGSAKENPAETVREKRGIEALQGMDGDLLRAERHPGRVGLELASRRLGHGFKEGMDPGHRIGASYADVAKHGRVLAKFESTLAACGLVSKSGGEEQERGLHELS